MIPRIGKGSPGFVLGVVIEEDRQTGSGLLCRGLREQVKTQEAEVLEVERICFLHVLFRFRHLQAFQKNVVSGSL